MGHAAVFNLYSCVPRGNESFLAVRPTVSFLRLAAIPAVPHRWDAWCPRSKRSGLVLPQADLSIMTPRYNRLWALSDAIHSCRGTRCCTEVIVVDDESSDATRHLSLANNMTSSKYWGKAGAFKRSTMHGLGSG